MSAPFNDLQNKLETAALSVIDGLTLSTTFTTNKGQSDETLQAPYAVAAVTGNSGEEVKGTNVIRLQLDIMVASPVDDGDTPQATHAEDVATVFDAFLDDGIAATLSAAEGDFYVYDVENVGSASDRQERDIMDTLNLEVVCCANDIV